MLALTVKRAYKRKAGKRRVAISYAKKLSIEDLEAIINEKRYEEKARKMREADERDL